MDNAHFLAASSLTEGTFKYLASWFPCVPYTASPFRLWAPKMPFEWIADEEYMKKIFDASFVDGLFEKSPTCAIEIPNI